MVPGVRIHNVFTCSSYRSRKSRCVTLHTLHCTCLYIGNTGKYVLRASNPCCSTDAAKYTKNHGWNGCSSLRARWALRWWRRLLLRCPNLWWRLASATFASMDDWTFRPAHVSSHRSYLHRSLVHIIMFDKRPEKRHRTWLNFIRSQIMNMCSGAITRSKNVTKEHGRETRNTQRKSAKIYRGSEGGVLSMIQGLWQWFSPWNWKPFISSIPNVSSGKYASFSYF